MPYDYEGLATVTVLALYQDQPPVELTSLSWKASCRCAFLFGHGD